MSKRTSTAESESIAAREERERGLEDCLGMREARVGDVIAKHAARTELALRGLNALEEGDSDFEAKLEAATDLLRANLAERDLVQTVTIELEETALAEGEKSPA